MTTQPTTSPRRVLTDDEYETAYTAAARAHGPIDGMLAAAFAAVGILTPPPPLEPDTCTARLIDLDGEWRQCAEEPGHDSAHSDGDWMWVDDHPRATPAVSSGSGGSRAQDGAQ